MLKALLVGAGGFIGSILRYAVNLSFQRWSDGLGFPFGTFIVNIIGCLIIGFLAQMAETGSGFTPEIKVFIFVGILGGFTTFSSFGKETMDLLAEGKMALAICSVSGHLILGFGAVWLGRMLARQVMQ